MPGAIWTPEQIAAVVVPGVGAGLAAGGAEAGGVGAGLAAAGAAVGGIGAGLAAAGAAVGGVGVGLAAGGVEVGGVGEGTGAATFVVAGAGPAEGFGLDGEVEIAATLVAPVVLFAVEDGILITVTLPPERATAPVAFGVFVAVLTDGALPRATVPGFVALATTTLRAARRPVPCAAPEVGRSEYVTVPALSTIL